MNFRDSKLAFAKAAADNRQDAFSEPAYWQGQLIKIVCQPSSALTQVSGGFEDSNEISAMTTNLAIAKRDTVSMRGQKWQVKEIRHGDHENSLTLTLIP